MEGPTPLKMQKAWNGLCPAGAADDDGYRTLTSLSVDVCAVYCLLAGSFPIVIGTVIISTQDGQQDAF